MKSVLILGLAAVSRSPTLGELQDFQKRSKLRSGALRQAFFGGSAAWKDRGQLRR